MLWSQHDEFQISPADILSQKPKPPKGKAKAKANTKAKAEPAPKAKPKATNTSSDSPISGKKVIVSGTVPGHDRKSAHAIVENAGAEIAKSLNKQVRYHSSLLQIVVADPHPGRTRHSWDQRWPG